MELNEPECCKSHEMAALTKLKNSKNMMNEIFRFLSGNTIVHSIRLLNKMCNTISKEVGPLQAQRIILLKPQDKPYCPQSVNNLEALLSYTDHVIISSEDSFPEDIALFEETMRLNKSYFNVIKNYR